MPSRQSPPSSASLQEPLITLLQCQFKHSAKLNVYFIYDQLIIQFLVCLYKYWFGCFFPSESKCFSQNSGQVFLRIHGRQREFMEGNK